MNDLENAIDLAVDAYADETDKGGATYIRYFPNESSERCLNATKQSLSI